MPLLHFSTFWTFPFAALFQQALPFQVSLPVAFLMVSTRGQLTYLPGDVTKGVCGVQLYKMHHPAQIFIMQCVNILDLSLKAPYNVFFCRKDKQEKLHVSFTSFIKVVTQKQSDIYCSCVWALCLKVLGKWCFYRKLVWPRHSCTLIELNSNRIKSLKTC